MFQSVWGAALNGLSELKQTQKETQPDLSADSYEANQTLTWLPVTQQLLTLLFVSDVSWLNSPWSRRPIKLTSTMLLPKPN